MREDRIALVGAGLSDLQVAWAPARLRKRPLPPGHAGRAMRESAYA